MSRYLVDALTSSVNLPSSSDNAPCLAPGAKMAAATTGFPETESVTTPLSVMGFCEEALKDNAATKQIRNMLSTDFKFRFVTWLVIIIFAKLL